jgi:D-alanyl-D-alanine carboxypeptidase
MNKKSWILGMKRTVYSNPHGLPNCLNKSCASDLVALIDYALRKPLFRQIVSCTYFEAKINVKKNKR